MITVSESVITVYSIRLLQLVLLSLLLSLLVKKKNSVLTEMKMYIYLK